ncbi:MAG: nucleotidyl transferase AbiEii/AbiGii toxin family protein [Clostridiales bacterium]|nr:nucleotidyl transferase AbiEii/AbiGii toxin family protein [Clostridiales bacterium]
MAYLHEAKEQFLNAINLTFAQTGIMTQAIEKDYYVTMILRQLSKRLPYVVFKGGTSLSKCYGVINRFSEDIDITIDIALSQEKKKKVKENIVEIAGELGMNILNLEKTRSRRDYNRYEVGYASVLPSFNEMLQSTVLVETSYTVVSFPTVVLPVTNYLGKMMEIEAANYIEEYQLDPFEMKVQGMDRTLADKVFAVCDYYLQNHVKGHSRHLYDIYKLYSFVPQDESFRKLIVEVRKARAKSNICPSAQLGADVPALLKKIIREKAYKADYDNLTMQLLGEQIPYSIVIETLGKVADSGLFGCELCDE